MPWGHCPCRCRLQRRRRFQGVVDLLARHEAGDRLLDEPHTRRLLTQFATVVRATVKGNIVVALIQGALGGIAFAVLGQPGAVLWGAACGESEHDPGSLPARAGSSTAGTHAAGAAGRGF